MEKFYRDRAAYDARVQAIDFRKNQFFGSGFGAMGMMGNLGQMINKQAMLGGVGGVAGIDAKIRRLENPEFSGSRITDSLGYLRQAQEAALKPQDETAKEQLAELKAIKEAILKSTPDGKPAGMVLRGRES